MSWYNPEPVPLCAPRLSGYAGGSPTLTRK